MPQTDATWRLIFCLRLAAVLHRSRDDSVLPTFCIRQNAGAYQFELPGDWLAANPLSAAVLVDETLAWRRVGSGLRIKRSTSLAAVV